MKKIITIIFCLLVSATMMGQVSTTVVAQHLEFMGISIDGDINNFLGELEKKGYKLHKTDPTAEVTYTDLYNQKTDVREAIVARKYALISKSL